MGVCKNSHPPREENEVDTEKQGAPDIPLNLKSAQTLHWRKKGRKNMGAFITCLR